MGQRQSEISAAVFVDFGRPFFPRSEASGVAYGAVHWSEISSKIVEKKESLKKYKNARHERGDVSSDEDAAMEEADEFSNLVENSLE